MKTSFKIIILLFLTHLSTQAQTWVTKMQDTTQNFYSIQQEFNNFWQNKTYERGKGYKAFRRWEWFTEPRVYPSGDLKLGSRSKAFEEFQKYLLQNPAAAQKINSTTATSATGNWTPMGPFGSPINGDAGRLTFIRFMPGDLNTIFVGTGAGGLWVSTDAGINWSTNTNSLAVLGCSDLAIDPVNTNIMYLATGDVDAGDTYSTGILKSIDGGITWNTTGISWPVSNGRRIGRLLLNPLRPNSLFAATSQGLYRTNNGGTTWTLLKIGNFKDMEYKPGDTSTVYGVTSGSLFRSTTGGNTPASFTQITSGLTTSGVRFSLAVTPADPNYVYILNSASNNGYGGVFRSINSGTNFTLMSTTPNIFGWDPSGSDSGGQGWYDIAIGVSPTNKDEITCGGVNTWKSLDGGVNWTLNTHWYGGGAPYVHADLHAVEYISGTTCYLGHDGGISRTTDGGVSWTTINGQMDIAQSYRIGQSTTTANYVLSGHQDNGTNLLNGTTWREVYGGDGADCFVDRTNNNVLVESYVNGDFNLSNNGGLSWTGITSGITGSAAWIAPIIQSPHVANTYYCGYQQVFRTTNKGTSWTQMGTISGGGGQILYLAAAPSNSLVLYAATSGNLYKTINAGVNWTQITTGLPVGSAQITRVAVDNTDANNIFVTFSGYSATNKVFASTDGGLNYTNISTGLPNLPVNCIIYSNNLNDAIYVGTDVGVYYRDGSMTSWTPFMTGLPNVVVNDFEIFYPTSKIRAATYGRGVWQSDLNFDPLAVPVANFSTAYSSACVNTAFVFNDQSSNAPNAWNWTLAGATPSISAVKNPTVSYSATGIYTVSLTSSNANGSSTVFTRTISVIAPPTLSLVATVVCNGQPATINASGATTYNWSSGTTGSSASVLPSVNTVYTCTGYVGACSSTQSITVYVESVASPTITQVGLVLNSNASSGNQWYLNGSPILGETSQTYTVSQNGYYSVWLTSPLGCQSSSQTLLVSVTGLESFSYINSISISPNPVKDVMYINSSVKDLKKISYTIYSIKGQLIKSGEALLNNRETLSLSDLSTGVYEIRFTSDRANSTYKFVKE